MTDLRKSSSRPDVAAGGMDVEDAFAALDPATSQRLEREAEATVAAVKEQNRRAPDSKGATHGRDEYAGS